MSTNKSRDISRLRREDLLDDYLKLAQARGGALVATALRSRSVEMRDILVRGAVGCVNTSAELKDLVLSGKLELSDILDVDLLGDLGRLVVLQDLLEDDTDYGNALLSIAHEAAGPNKLSKQTRTIYIQKQISIGNLALAQRLLEQSPDIDREFHGYLRAETVNPFLTSERNSHHEWIDNFNKFFTKHELAPVSLSTCNRSPFDRLQSEATANSIGNGEADPLVSVVLTSYQPEANELETSVRSILEQTWANLELIIVDDASGPEYLKIFQEIEDADPRVQVIHADVNRGTYTARNIGYAAASGEFITGQDDDDWSHPERIERQVGPLIDDPTLVGCRGMAIAADHNLGRCRPGYKPVVLNASSLMIRRSGYEQVGNYLESRKAADTEYYLRLKKVTGAQIADLKEPVGVIRIRKGSLSRSDFAAGWRHPTRAAFRSSYEYWHEQHEPETLAVRPGSHPPIRIPYRFRISPREEHTRQLDVVLAGDWHRYGGPQKSMLEEIAALLEEGYRVGVLNLEAARFMHSGGPQNLNDKVQKLINDGTIDEVFLDDLTHVRLLILRYPPILQFITHISSRLEIGSMVILANQAPSELDGSDIRYLVSDCHNNARDVFRVDPVWIPQGPQVRDFLRMYLDAPVLADFDMPGVLDVDQWWHERAWYRSTMPVVGRHSRDDVMKWPADKDVLEEIYRTDGTYDVRIMGGSNTPLRVLETQSVPPAWSVYRKDALPVPDFLYSLDYFVFFQHPQAVEAFGRAILEAIAAGVVVILPKHFERVFGPAALYAEVDEVRALIQDLHSDFSKYRAQLSKSKAILRERFSYSAYTHLIERLLSSAR